jgi:TATA-binding protein-associated factor
MEHLTYLPPPDSEVLAGTDDAQKELRIKKRGASMALEEVASGLGAGAFKVLPALWTRIHDPIITEFGAAPDASEAHLKGDKMQEVVDSFQVACCIAGALVAEDLKTLTTLMPAAVRALESKHAPLRHMAARFLSEICCVDPLAGMEAVIRTVVPLLGDAARPARRLGATEALYKIVNAMELKVRPHVTSYGSLRMSCLFQDASTAPCLHGCG